MGCPLFSRENSENEKYSKIAVEGTNAAQNSIRNSRSLGEFSEQNGSSILVLECVGLIFLIEM
jgi:hypothetical protein